MFTFYPKKQIPLIGGLLLFDDYSIVKEFKQYQRAPASLQPALSFSPSTSIDSDLTVLALFIIGKRRIVHQIVMHFCKIVAA